MIFVLAYPTFEPAVARSIDAFRQLHEPDRATLVRPYVTLVFGVRSLSSAALCSICDRVLKDQPPIDISLIGQEVVHDPFEQTYKLMLTVGVGAELLQHLRQRLYDGPHRHEWRSDRPYRAHVTVGTNTSRSRLDNLDLAEIGVIPIPATIRSVEVVALEKGALKLLRDFPLQEKFGR